MIIWLLEHPQPTLSRPRILSIIADESQRQPIEWGEKSHANWMLVLDTVGLAIAEGADERLMALLEDQNVPSKELHASLTQIMSSSRLRSESLRQRAAAVVLKEAAADLRLRD